MSMYAEVLKTKLTHSLVAPTVSQEVRTVEHAREADRVEPELIATTANMKKFAAINLTQASPD